MTASVRWQSASAYTSEVMGFDDGYRPTWTKLTIPAAEGPLAGEYQTTHSYHVDGSPATTVLQGKGGLNTETLTHGYEETGLPTTLSGPGSYVSDTIWSPFGQPLQYAMGNTFGKTIWSTYAYEPATRRLESAQLDRQVAATYDSLVSYSYDPAGNVTSIADAPEVGAADTQCFDYDHLRRLTQAWTPSSGDCQATPSVAGLGGPAPYWQSWTLDAVGNRLTQTTHAAAGDTVSTYSYPAAGRDRPHAVSQVDTTGPGTGQDGTYGYDQAGNTTTRPYGGDEQTQAWDAEGHLESVTDSGGAVAGFVYDADGNRLIRRDNATGKTTLYWGGHTELTHTQSTGWVKAIRYYQLNGTVVAVRDGKFQNNVTTLISDHHGTASYAVNDWTGALTTRRFDPYGNPRGAVPSGWKGDHGYLNGPTDLTLGLTHLGAREYDPTLGKFLSVDPLVDVMNPQTLNAYAYANNSPVTFTDPDGLAFAECDGGCSTNNGNGRIAVPTPGGGHKVTGQKPKPPKPPVKKPPKSDTPNDRDEQDGGSWSQEPHWGCAWGDHLCEIDRMGTTFNPDGTTSWSFQTYLASYVGCYENLLADCEFYAPSDPGAFYRFLEASTAVVAGHGYVDLTGCVVLCVGVPSRTGICGLRWAGSASVAGGRSWAPTRPSPRRPRQYRLKPALRLVLEDAGTWARAAVAIRPTLSCGRAAGSQVAWEPSPGSSSQLSISLPGLWLSGRGLSRSPGVKHG